MGLWDRDYWRERHNKRSGYKECARFRMPADGGEDVTDHPYFKGTGHKVQRERRPWHPVLQVILFVCLCLLVIVVLDVVS